MDKIIEHINLHTHSFLSRFWIVLLFLYVFLVMCFSCFLFCISSVLFVSALCVCVFCCPVKFVCEMEKFVTKQQFYIENEGQMLIVDSWSFLQKVTVCIVVTFRFL